MKTKQKRIDANIINGIFYFPCCNVGIISSNRPTPTNEDDEHDYKAQFMCQYGCGFQFT